jgi:hypothetical protein
MKLDPHFMNYSPNGRVTRKVAQIFIGGSTWILNHKSGRPVRMKGYSSNVYEIAGDQRVDFANKTFLVGRAIKHCVKTIEEYIDSFEMGQPWPREDLIHRLSLNVRGAVMINGKEYPRYHYRHMIGDHMKLNWYSIKVSFFVNCFLAILPKSMLIAE